MIIDHNQEKAGQTRKHAMGVKMVRPMRLLLSAFPINLTRPKSIQFRFSSTTVCNGMESGGGAGEGSKKLQLYSYWRSSCSNRVRIALNLKGLEYEYNAVHLLKGEQKAPEFLKLNPLGYVPVLVDDDIVVADSLAVILYLEGKFPQHPLLPQDLQRKAINYQAANIVGSSIQPYLNLPIVKIIREKLGPDEEVAWVREHIRKGFTALEKLLKDYAGKYATGDEVYLADLFLAPQIDGAIRRFKLDMNDFPILSRINEAYSKLPAFQDASPERQPDTPPEHRS